MRRALVRNLALALGSVVVAVSLCEGLLRAFDIAATLQQSGRGWPWTVYDPVLGGANQAGFAHETLGFEINSLGFRGPEIQHDKPPGTWRIACLGDSATFGVWKETAFRVRADVSYPEVLAKLIEARGAEHVQVVNAGVLGYTTATGLRQLLTRVLPLDPDVVTVRYGNNDHALARYERVSLFRDESLYLLMRVLPPRVFDWQLVRLGLHLHRGTVRPAAQSPTRRVPIDEFERNLRRFVTIAHDHGVHLLFIDFPYRALEREKSPDRKFPTASWFSGARTLREHHEIHDTYQRVVRAVAAETKTPVLDTAESFRRSPVPVFSARDLSHPNQAGIELLAQLLLEKLEALGWLPPTPHNGPH